MTINFLYSFGLKNIPLVDVVILSSGFVLRVLFGATVVGVSISNWLYLTVITGALYLGLGKRRNEILFQKQKTRKVLRYYTYEYLDKNMYMSLALSIVFYSLWCIDPITIAKLNQKSLVISIPLLLFIILKYNLNIESNSDGDPIEVILSDKLLILLILIYCILMVTLFYF